MARNQEKAQALLNRWVQMKRDAGKEPEERRPYLATDVTNLKSAEKWRSQVIREISREVMTIQNASLGEHKIRDVNDKINKLLREKRAWERQIHILGGPNYAQLQPKVLDGDGKAALGTDGYFYFGAAKDLPGVRELFEKQEVDKKAKTRGELYKQVDADYYGYRDDDEGLLEKLEAEEERKAVTASVQEWMKTADPIARLRFQKAAAEEASGVLKAHVVLPSQDEIQQMVLAKKKQELLAKLGATM